MNTAVIADSSFVKEPKRAPPSSLSLRELLTPVFYYRRRAWLAFLIPVALAVVACLFAHPVYVAQSRLLILLGGDYVFKGAPNDPGSTQSFDRFQIVHAEMEILSARDLYTDAIKAEGLARVYPGVPDSPSGMELAVNRLAKDLTIDNVPQSNVIELKLRNRDPQVAAELLNKLVALYVDRRQAVFKRADPSYMTDQQKALSQRLSALEAQLTDFSTRHDIGDYAAAFSAAQSQQDQIQAQLQALDQQIASRAGQTGQLSSRMQSTPPVVSLTTENTRSQQLDTLTANLATLQNERREAAEKFRDGYPLIAALATVILSSALSEQMVAPGDVEEKLRVPVLLTVNKGHEDRPRVRLRNGAVSSSYLSPDDARILLQLLSSVQPDNGRVLQLIGASGGEGVSSLALDIAAIAASREARKVLLLDVEPANGQSVIGALTASGHAATPVSEARRTYRIDESDLYVTAPLGPGGERVSEDRWPKAIENARKTYDLVLINAPPLARSSAGIELAALADMTLLVVEAEHTRAPVARRLIERVQAAGGQVLGVILNKRRFYIPRFIYSWL